MKKDIYLLHANNKLKNKIYSIIVEIKEDTQVEDLNYMLEIIFYKLSKLGEELDEVIDIDCDLNNNYYD